MGIPRGIHSAGIVNLLVYAALFFVFARAEVEYSGLDIAIYFDTSSQLCTENKQELISFIARISADLKNKDITDVVYHFVSTPKYEYHGQTVYEDLIAQVSNISCVNQDNRNRHILLGLGKIANVLKGHNGDILAQDPDFISWRSRSKKMVLAFIRDQKDILRRYSCVLGIVYEDLKIKEIHEGCDLGDIDPAAQRPNSLEDAIITNKPTDSLDESVLNPQCSTYLENISGNMFLYDISAIIITASRNRDKCLSLSANSSSPEIDFSPVQVVFGHPDLDVPNSNAEMVSKYEDYNLRGSLQYLALQNDVYLRVRELSKVLEEGIESDLDIITSNVSSDSLEKTHNHYKQYVVDKASIEEVKKCKRVSDYNYECMRYIEEDALSDFSDLPKGFFSVNEESYSQHDIQRNNPHFNNRLNISQDSIPYSRVTKLEKQDLSFLDKYRSASGYIDFDNIKSPYILGESLMHTRQYGRGLNLHLEDALNEIIKYATAAFIRYHIFWSTVQYAAADRYVTYKYRALVRDVPRYFMDPLLVVPYRMIRSSRSLFKPTQKGACPYFMLIFSHATTDSGFNTLYGGLSESMNLFYEFYEDACKHGSVEPLESCDMHRNPYFSYTSNATHPELLTVINLEDYYTGNPTYNRFTSKYSGVSEIFSSITGEPFLVHQYNENMPATQFTDFPVAGRKRCALDLEKQIYGANQDGFIGKNYWRRVVDGGRLKDSGEKIREWWRSKADVRNGLDARSWMSGANKTLDHVIDNQKFVGYKGKTYRRFPLRSEDQLKKEIKEDYANFIKEMEEKTGYNKRTPERVVIRARSDSKPVKDNEYSVNPPQIMDMCGSHITRDLVKNLDIVEEDIHVYE